MTGYATFILTLAPSILLGAGACAVAAWAARLPDDQSAVVARLTGQKCRPGTGTCPPDKHE
jgi:hypothetical protein